MGFYPLIFYQGSQTICHRKSDIQNAGECATPTNSSIFANFSRNLANAPLPPESVRTCFVCSTHARTLLPAALASVPFGFVLVRVRQNAGRNNEIFIRQRDFFFLPNGSALCLAQGHEEDFEFCHHFHGHPSMWVISSFSTY